MNRTLIGDIIDIGESEIISISGWIIKKHDKFFVHDISGEILLGQSEYNLGDRDVVSMRGYISKNEVKEECFIPSEISILNKASKIVNLQSTEHDYLKKSYQYYHDLTKIEFLKKTNQIKNIITNYLENERFIELNNPLLWTSVQEYGRQELSVVESGGENRYFLPQSPNVQNLISVIGGIERNFQFNHCFRVTEESNNEDSVYEFTQLAITAGFYSTKDGQELIEQMLKKIFLEMKLGTIGEIKTISFEESIRKYGDDKPDLRYEKFLTPIINVELLNATKECLSILIPDIIDYDFLKKVFSLLEQRFKDIEYCVNDYNNGNISYQLGNLIPSKINFNFNELDFSKGIIVLLNGADYKEKNILKSIIATLYKYMYGRVPEYSICWVTKYPYIDVRKRKSTSHDNIGQNIFTKIEDASLEENQRSYETCHTCGVDLVINGVEIASGGEKEHRYDNFIQNLKYLKIDNYKDKYNYYLDALQEGAPPFFSIGIGWERLLWVLLKPAYFSELFIFPKNSDGKCLLTSNDYDVLTNN